MEKNSGRITRLVKNLPIPVVSWEILHQGDWQDAYLLTRKEGASLVLKIPKKAFDAWEKKMKREAWMLGRLKNEKLSPQIIYADYSKKIVPFSFHLLSYIEGKGVGKTKTDLKDIAIQLRKLHATTFSKWGGLPPRRVTFTFETYFNHRFSDQLKRLPKRVQHQLRPILVELRDELRTHPCRQRFCLTHGDINTRNVVRTPKKDLVFIDWEGADVCPPARDIADLFVIERLTKSQRAAFLDAYGDSSEAMNQEIHVFERLVATAELLDDLETGKDVISLLEKEVRNPPL